MANTSTVNTQFPPLPTVAELIATLHAALQNEANGEASIITNFNEGGVTETWLRAIAVALGVDAASLAGSTVAGAYAQLQNVQNAAYILTAKGPYLDLKAADVGIYRKGASFASGQGVFIPSPGQAPPSVDTVIEAGTVVGSNSADPTQSAATYVTATTITYPANAPQSPLVSIVASQAGSASNRPVPDTVSLVLSGPSGLAFSNTTGVMGGLDEEDDDSPNGGLRARALAAIPNGSTTKAAIEQAARNYVGVTTAWLKENTDADGVTFLRGKGQLYVDDGSGNMASNNAPLLAQIQADFNSGLYRAASTEVDVRGSVKVPVLVALSIYYSAAYVASGAGTLDQIIAKVQAAVFAYVNSVGIGRAVTLAGILEAAASVPGVANVMVPSIQLNGIAADLTPSLNQTLRCDSSASVTVTSLGTSAFFG